MQTQTQKIVRLNLNFLHQPISVLNPRDPASANVAKDGSYAVENSARPMSSYDKQILMYMLSKLNQDERVFEQSSRQILLGSGKCCSGKDYKRLQESLRRIAGTTLKFEGSFYQDKAKGDQTIKIVDSYEIDKYVRVEFSADFLRLNEDKYSRVLDVQDYLEQNGTAMRVWEMFVPKLYGSEQISYSPARAGQALGHKARYPSDTVNAIRRGLSKLSKSEHLDTLKVEFEKGSDGKTGHKKYVRIIVRKKEEVRSAQPDQSAAAAQPAATEPQANLPATSQPAVSAVVSTEVPTAVEVTPEPIVVEVSAVQAAPTPAIESRSEPAVSEVSLPQAAANAIVLLATPNPSIESRSEPAVSEASLSQAAASAARVGPIRAGEPTALSRIFSKAVLATLSKIEPPRNAESQKPAVAVEAQDEQSERVRKVRHILSSEKLPSRWQIEYERLSESQQSQAQELLLGLMEILTQLSKEQPDKVQVDNDFATILEVLDKSQKSLLQTAQTFPMIRAEYQRRTKSGELFSNFPGFFVNAVREGYRFVKVEKEQRQAKAQEQRELEMQKFLAERTEERRKQEEVEKLDKRVIEAIEKHKGEINIVELVKDLPLLPPLTSETAMERQRISKMYAEKIIAELNAKTSASCPTNGYSRFVNAYMMEKYCRK